MTPEQDQQLKSYIFSSFSSPLEFNGWLCMHIWPAFKARNAQNEAKEREARRVERNQMKQEKQRLASPISARFVALDGTPMTTKEVEKAATNGVPLKEITTSRHMIFKARTKNLGSWIEVPKQP